MQHQNIIPKRTPKIQRQSFPFFFPNSLSYKELMYHHMKGL